ncbi:dimethylhistidine N-methyltransferase [Actinacidiphila rubida]|uniref:Gamma-glutamyl-hercynylcysteine sulfoxide hydrolase n=4 Tax=Actinacidiphila rubida TaxID=310780 RepID=A0A1H8M9D6_9ACTN|nr:dimethylhistidine N-methyltransferase [Actinacidiphila rubida]
MCRHLAYLGPPVPLARLLTEPPRGLYEQAWRPRRQRHGTVNADGFGVGWYLPGPAAAAPEDAGESAAGSAAGDDGFARPARYRRAVPLWADENAVELFRAVTSGAVLAAVRSATAGTTQDESAAAPFRDGRWLFSHNGAVPDWTRLPTTLPSAELLAMEARSDSALLWAMAVHRLRQGEPPGGVLAAVVREVAAARPTARLNLLLTDGRTIAATAWGDTLWYRTGPDHVLVASEPDDAPGEWHEVPDRSLLLATTAGVRVIALRPVRTDSKDTLMTESRFTLDDRLPTGYFTESLRADVLAGLGGTPRTLPPKWFYDKRGSDLFEQITRLPEYYPTRAEQEILEQRAPEIAELTKAATLVELGSGSSRKTRLLLDALTARGTLQRYAPLDVSSTALAEAGEAICRDYPRLRVAGTVADFETDLSLDDDPGPRLLAFLGSTIGNLDSGQRLAFYRTLSLALSGDDVLLLGADLVKDPDVLVRAYDDAAGVTAEFDKNVLHVLNRELGADFDPDGFEHVALWNADEERIEMRLRARTAQTVKIPDLDLSLDFAQAEDLRTELSCKFRRESLTRELHEGGFTVRHWWTDSEERFALLLAVPN